MREYRYSYRHQENKICRIVPTVGSVISFTYKKKKLNGKVVVVSKKTDSFEVEANGTTFLCSYFLKSYVADSIVKTKKH